MERVNGHNLEPNTTYYIELDNDSLRQYGAYSAKHYGKFIEYVDNYAYFENIENISPFYKFSKKERKSVGGVYWKFFKKNVRPGYVFGATKLVPVNFLNSYFNLNVEFKFFVLFPPINIIS